MELLSFRFLIFCAIVIIVYFAVPKRMQWWVLLAASMVFYASGGGKNVIFVLITGTSTYLATLLMQRMADTQKAWLKENKSLASKEEKDAYKAKILFRRRVVLVVALVLNFGLLGYFKYFQMILNTLTHIIGGFGGEAVADLWELIVPLGISFYTFQTMGYLIDVYWKKYTPEKNYLKVLLFVSFFPQMTQGPISDFKALTTELFTKHSFTYHQFSWGVQRVLWGLFKKLAIANILLGFVGDVFANYHEYSALTTLLGAFMYSVEIYADFSGYMDIICGFSEILGIHLTENFERPYFSKSIAEYWRRWHITLGVWFKTYIYYPMAMLKWNQKLGRWCKKHFGKYGKMIGNTLPATIALVVVWLVTGLWHGASWAYVAWGGVNGIFIIFALWMEPITTRWKNHLGIRENAFYWRAFTVIRTFVFVTFIKVLPEVGTLRDGLGLWKNIFTSRIGFHTWQEFLPFVDLETMKLQLIVVIAGTAAIFITSLIQRKQPIRQWLEDHTNYCARIFIFAGLFIVIMLFGYPTIAQTGGFMYAQF